MNAANVPVSLSSSSSSPSSLSGISDAQLLPAVILLSPFQTLIVSIIALVIGCCYLLISNTSAGTQSRWLNSIRSVLISLFDYIVWHMDSFISVLSPTYWLSAHPHAHAVRMMDLVTFTPPSSWQVSSERFRSIAGGNFGLPDESVDFCMKLLAKSGLGESTHFPPGICDNPPHIQMIDARAEAETILFDCIDQLFTNNPTLSPSSIDILIINCSLFCPTPSLCSMIINKYKMPHTIQSYQLGGMGCSAGLLSLHLAYDLLQVYRNSRAIIISTENITQNIYLGREVSMLISNSLFRCGGAAILLSNKSSDHYLSSRGCLYSLLWTSRTHLGSNDTAYRCVYQHEDDRGFKGVQLSKDLLVIASKAMTLHLSSIATRLLTYSEIIKYSLYKVAYMIIYYMVILVHGKKPREKKSTHTDNSNNSNSDNSTVSSSSSVLSTLLSWCQYSPSFSGSVLPCIHAGGAGVLNGIQTALKLTDEDMAVSRQLLYDMGNVSSASVWYEMQLYQRPKQTVLSPISPTSLLETGAGTDKKEEAEAQSRAKSRIRSVNKGDRVWQLAFGSGFKCNSALWKAL